MNSQIFQIEYFLPNNILTNKDLENRFLELKAEKIYKKVGIKSRHIVSENETALDIALKASEKILQDFDKNLIDFILLCTQSPDFYLPTGACILQDKLGLRTDIGALVVLYRLKT